MEQKGSVFPLKCMAVFAKEAVCNLLASSDLWMYMESQSCPPVQVEASHYLHFIHKNGPH